MMLSLLIIATVAEEARVIAEQARTEAALYKHTATDLVDGLPIISYPEAPYLCLYQTMMIMIWTQILPPKR